MQEKDFKDEKDLFIEQKMKEDIFVSKKYDNTFEKIMKGDLKMENQNQNQNEANVMQQKSPKGFFRWAVATAACVLIFGGANIYATTQGYENIFFMIKDLTTPTESVQVNTKEDILADRDITISYSNIEIAKGLKVQINKLVIKDNQAKLYIRVDQREKNGTYITKFVVRDTTDNKNVQVGLNKESVTDDLITYTECILLENITNDVKNLELDLYDQNNKKISTMKIDILNREIIVESDGEQSSFKKLSESDLKEILGLFAHFYKENDDDNLQDKIFEMAVKLVTSNGDYATKENVNKAMTELTGVSLGNSNNRGNIAGTIVYNEENEAYMYKLYEVDSPLVFDISELIYNNGTYTATIVYSMPTHEDYDEGRVDKLEKYEMTLNFKLNEEYKYSEFCLTNIDDLKRTLIKNNTQKPTATPANNNEQQPTATPENINGEVQPTKTPVAEPHTDSNTYTVNADDTGWKEIIIDAVKLKYPENWDVTEYTKSIYVSEEQVFEEGLWPNACITGNVLKTDNETEENMAIWLYGAFYVKAKTEEEVFKNIPPAYFDSKLPSGKYTTAKGQDWYIIQLDGSAHEYYVYLFELNDGYVVNTISTGYYEDANASRVKKEILDSLESGHLSLFTDVPDAIFEENWKENQIDKISYSCPNDWVISYSTQDNDMGEITSIASGIVRGLNYYRNKVADTYIEIRTYIQETYKGLGENAEDDAIKQYANSYGLAKTETQISLAKNQIWSVYKKEGDEKSTWYFYAQKSYQNSENDKPIYTVTAVQVYNTDSENNTAITTIAALLNTLHVED